MKKIIIMLITSALIVFFISGCGRAGLGSSKNNTAGTSAEVTKDTSKLTDDDLMSIANDKDETAAAQDNIDLDKELNDLDNIINQNDTLSDIPTNINLK